MRDDTRMGQGDGGFPATRWSAVRSARSDDEAERGAAMAAMTAVYWRPIYKYLRLRWKRSNEDAKDLTQEFFVRLIANDVLAGFDPERARLRTFLRTCVDRLVQNLRRDAARLKRGGGVQLLPMDFVAAEAELVRGGADVSVEELFDREWVRSLFGLAVDDLQAQCEAKERELDFRLFELYDLVEEAAERPTYRQLAAELGVAETTVTNRLAAARRDFRRLVLTRLRQMTASEEEYRSEARAVLGVEP